MDKLNRYKKWRKDRLLAQLFSLMILFLMTSCGTGKSSGVVQVKDYNELRELINNQGIEIEQQWAYPLSGDMVNLIGNPNFIRFKNDSVDLFLPYFGVRHSGGNYGGRDGGIKYEGIAEELKITEAEKDSKITIEFEAEEGTENYDFRITLFSNGNTSTSVTSSERNAITYKGIVKKLPEESENDKR